MGPTFGTVISQDPDNYGVLVVLDGAYGQSGPTVSVQVGTYGPRDAMRGNYPELPLQGQRGVILFPRNDNRNGVWICSIPSALNDSNPNKAAGLPQHVELAYGGGVFWRGPDGSEVTEYPDGSVLQIGPSTPSLTRHTVGSGQARSVTPFPLAQRVGKAPAASFGLVYTQAGTGASLALSSSGGWTITAAPGQDITIQVSGGASISLSGMVIAMVADTNITMDTPALAVSGAVMATGDITGSAGTGADVTMLGHVHGTGTAAAGTVAPTPGH